MTKIVDTKEYLDTVMSLLNAGSTNVPVPVAGSSMCPFLHPGDYVYLDLPLRPIRRGDIVLFNRVNGDYILHRVAKVHLNGTYEMLGDAQTSLEPVNDARFIRAVVTSVRRKERYLTEDSLLWKFFSTVWLWIAPFRPLISRLYTLVRKIMVL